MAGNDEPVVTPDIIKTGSHKNTGEGNMREFVRHPSSIPIELAVGRSSECSAPCLRNISSGGFACAVDEPIEVGETVRLRIPMIWPEYRGCGVVVWCQPAPPRYEVGIRFGAQDMFKTKMVEQLCQIEHYRRRVLNEEGRELDSEQAAQEWIERYAREFSESFSVPAHG